MTSVYVCWVGLFEAREVPGQGVFLTGSVGCGPALIGTVYTGILQAIDSARRGLNAGRTPAHFCGKRLASALYGILAPAPQRTVNVF